MRSKLEYACSVWNKPRSYITDLTEEVQMRAFNSITHLSSLSYQEQLRRMRLTTLSFRRLRGQLIDTYKYVSGVYTLTHSRPVRFTANRTVRDGPILFRPRSNYRTGFADFYSCTIPELWNALPVTVRSAPTLNKFKQLLDLAYKDHPLKYDPKANWKLPPHHLRDFAI